MKKVVFVIMVLVGFYILIPRNRVVQYSFMNEIQMIEAVKIVTVSVDENDTNDIDVFEECTVIDVEEFIEDFHRVVCEKNAYAPFGLHSNTEYIFKIEYTNGEYELIDKLGIADYSLEYGMINYQGKYIFDIEMFDALIDKYLSNESMCSLNDKRTE